MSAFFGTFIIVFAAFLISFVLINLRGVVKGEEFRGTCSTNNPMLKNEIGECTVCGKSPDEDCKMPDVQKS